jgi:hypothetical protein
MKQDDPVTGCFWSRSESGRWLIAVPASARAEKGSCVTVSMRSGATKGAYLGRHVDECSIGGAPFVRFENDPDPFDAEAP